MWCVLLNSQNNSGFNYSKLDERRLVVRFSGRRADGSDRVTARG